jgi:hypothetical protein
VTAANAARGEVVVPLAGTPRRLCLTLGALAELEAAFEVNGFAGLAHRLRILSWIRSRVSSSNSAMAGSRPNRAKANPPTATSAASR